MLEKAIQIAAEIDTESSEKLDADALKEIISLVDYTTLNDTDTNDSVLNWMMESVNIMNSEGVYCGGWCVYPEFVPLIKENRNDLQISIACVSGNFPSGKAMSQLKVEESVYSESMGAEEIDVVINKGWAREGNYTKIEKEISLIKGALNTAHLKVILETGLLDPEQTMHASAAAIRAGADFIKTSTGKTERGASLEAVSIMCHVIKRLYDQTGKRVGIKPSGGISTTKEAAKYVQLVRRILGEEWISNKLFRIGASRLLQNAINDLNELNN
jgi:deoxyribose-phosphate aldolase